ncbi:MAG TPA: hypothetical protein DC049_18330 [Spirochaetia bacterium]|nr:hypothetical protein [Spirochaetia bacterium]
MLYPHNQTPANIKNPIEDMEKQFGCLRYMQGDYEHASFDTYRLTREDMGEHGVVGLCLSLPTLMLEMRQPNEAMFYDYYDYPELIGKWMQMQLDKSISLAKQIIDSNLKPDFVFFPMSGLLTLQSEEIVRKYSYPALKTLTRMFKEAGILTSLHSCGKEYLTVEYAASETDLDCIDPLEVSPMGDCSLSDLKRKFGKRIALKGNLHTTEVMLRMKPDGVAKAARQCLDDAMAGGGFILSTGDQCGRDTPLENITTLVEVCEKYGKY